jgi:hypothetical protein
VALVYLLVARHDADLAYVVGALGAVLAHLAMSRARVRTRALTVTDAG